MAKWLHVQSGTAKKKKMCTCQLDKDFPEISRQICKGEGKKRKYHSNNSAYQRSLHFWHTLWPSRACSWSPWPIGKERNATWLQWRKNNDFYFISVSRTYSKKSQFQPVLQVYRLIVLVLPAKACTRSTMFKQKTCKNHESIIRLRGSTWLSSAAKIAARRRRMWPFYEISTVLKCVMIQLGLNMFNEVQHRTSHGNWLLLRLAASSRYQCYASDQG